MSFEKIAEQKIREALAEGEFDDLEGEGLPVDLDAYFAVPAELRAGFALLKNAGVLPSEIQLLKEIGSLRQELGSCHDEEDRRRLRKAIAEKRLSYDLLMEHYRHKPVAS